MKDLKEPNQLNVELLEVFRVALEAMSFHIRLS